jgi:hypothetical protein
MFTLPIFPLAQIIQEHITLISNENIYCNKHSSNGSILEDMQREVKNIGLRLLHHKRKSTTTETQKILNTDCVIGIMC